MHAQSATTPNRLLITHVDCLFSWQRLFRRKLREDANADAGNVSKICLYPRLVRNQLQHNNMMAGGGKQTCKVQFEPKHPL